MAALGGDGLLRPLAGALRDSDAALAMIPGGRGNDLARVLGIPPDPAAAARVAVQAPERLLDVASVDGAPFLGIASFGFDSDANRIANEAKLVKGNAVYLYAALRALAAWKPAAFTVDVDGERHEYTGYSVAVGNSKAYGGGMFVLPQAELDDGQLDVLRLQAGVEADLPARAAQGLQGRPRRLAPRARSCAARRSRSPPTARSSIYADGDPIGATPATIRVRAALPARHRARLMYRVARVARPRWCGP